MTKETEKMLTNLMRIIVNLKKCSVYDIATQYCNTFDIEIRDKRGRLTIDWHEAYRKVSYVLLRGESLGILSKNHITTKFEESTTVLNKKMHIYKGGKK